MYPGTVVDTIAPDPSTSPVQTSATSAALGFSWSAPAAGVDSGGYLVVRGLTDPSTTPNVNGVYAVGNTLASGQTVVYLGTTPSFTDNGLTHNVRYYYRIYTVDKAFNYSSAGNLYRFKHFLNHLLQFQRCRQVMLLLPMFSKHR